MPRTPADEFNHRYRVNDALVQLAAQAGATVPDDVLDALTHHVADTLDRHRPGWAVTPDRSDVRGCDSPPEAVAEAERTVFVLGDAVRLLGQRHPEIAAYIEHTGGGVMCLFAAPRTTDGRPHLVPAYGGAQLAWPILAGPGVAIPGTGTVEADLRDFSVGLDPNLDWQAPWNSSLADGDRDWIANPDTDSVEVIVAVIATKVTEFAALYPPAAPR